MNKNPTRDELLARVSKVKAYFKHKGIKRDEFIDNAYGSMYDSEHTRVLNLWHGNVTSLEFTQTLERYAEFPKKYLKQSAEFQRFFRFTEWYLRLGGETLTTEQIAECYPKFKLLKTK